MEHLSDGTLRRLYDDPLAISAQVRRHFDACPQCQSRFATIAAQARAAAALLAVPRVAIDPIPAYAAIRQRVSAQQAERRAPWYRHPLERITAMYYSNGRRLAKPVGGVIAAAALVGALALTPIGSFAQNLLTIFEPQQFVAVPVTTSDLQGLQSLRDLGQFGTFAQQTRPTAQQTTSAARAASATGLSVLTPATLPAGVPHHVTYTVLSHGVGTFTFSAAKASAAATAAGKTLPAMPASLDGSTLQLSIGPVVAATYGGNVQTGDTSGPGGDTAGPASRVKGHAVGVKGRLVRSARMDFTDIPTLIIAESAMPQVSSTGASVKQIRDYLLNQPGVSPTLAAEIRAIGDPSTTLPIPIPVNRATAQSVQVQGVSGLAVGDNTGLGSGVIWQKNGMVYGVAGSLPESQILAIANSLH